MRVFGRRAFFGVFVLSILFIASAWVCVRGEQIAASSTPAKGTTAEGGAPSPLDDTVSQDLEREVVNRPGVYDIHGTIWRTNEEALVEEYIARLEAAGSAKEFEQECNQIFRGKTDPRKRQPVPDAVVTLQGSSVTRRAVTDGEGRFQFLAFPRGEYELCAEKPVRSSRIGDERMTAARQRVKLDKDNSMDLTLRADRVSVRGRITDGEGRPVAGAKVTAEVEEWHDPAIGYPGDLVPDPETYSTVSSADGSYEFQCLDPTDFYKTGGYLVTASPRALRYVNIEVEADGFVQGKENVPRVPLVSEQGLDWGRRLMRAFARYSEEDLREKEDLSLPSLQGNIITGIDIVLKGGATAE